MAKAKQFRKPKKRPSRERQNALDDDKRDTDLEELWEVLSETARGLSWHIPWHSGANVVELCLIINRALAPGAEEFLDAVECLVRFVDPATRNISQYVYWRMQEHIEAITPRIHLAHERFIVAGLRCAQLSIANSHGGGQVYNDILERIWKYAPAEADRYVRDLRCKDALRLDWRFDNSSHDRRRRAFYTAWDRHLYQVAYAVGAPR